MNDKKIIKMFFERNEDAILEVDYKYRRYPYYNFTFNYFVVDHYYYFLTEDDVLLINEIFAK